MSDIVQDSVIRIALASMAADPASVLTISQRAWVIDLARRTHALTSSERLRLKRPLLAWIKERMPRCLTIIEQQYAEEP